MTNAPTIATNIDVQTINGLEVVKQVSEFYSSSFNQLLIVGSVLAALIGIVLPLLIQFYQSREMRIQTGRLKSELDAESAKLLDVVKAELHKELDAKFAEEKKTIVEALEKNTATIEKRLMKAEGNVYHIQGNGNLVRGKLHEACNDFCKAIELYCKSGNGSDMARLLKAITAQILPTLTKNDLEKEGLDDRLDKIMKEADKLEHNGFLNDTLRDLRAALRETKSRGQIQNKQ